MIKYFAITLLSRTNATMTTILLQQNNCDHYFKSSFQYRWQQSFTPRPHLYTSSDAIRQVFRDANSCFSFYCDIYFFIRKVFQFTIKVVFDVILVMTRLFITCRDVFSLCFGVAEQNLCTVPILLWHLVF